MPSGNNSDETEGIYLPNRRNLLKTLGVGGAAALAGCSSGPGNTTTQNQQTTTQGTTTQRNTLPDVEGTYTSALSSDAESLNWLTTADNTSGAYVGLALDGAWGIKTGQEIFPLWAEPSTDDGRVYDIKLRENLQWGAGYGQMTAEDWVYMIHNLFQSEKNWTEYTNRGDWWAVNPETGKEEPIPVEKTGKYSFRISLFQKDPAWPFKPILWGQYAFPKGLLQKYVPDKDLQGLKQDQEIQTLAYSGNLGPYKYDTWQRTAKYVTKRNEDYYMQEAEDVPKLFENAPYFNEYVYRIIKEQSTRLGALKTGEITAASIPPKKVSQFEGMDSISLYEQPQPYVEVLVYNMRDNGWEPFRKTGVRQALACAVNKEAYAKGIFRNYADVAQTMQPKWSKFYGDQGVENYGVGDLYGPEVTRNKLESALSDTEYSYDGDTLVDGKGEQVELSLFYNAGQPVNKTQAEFTKQGFEQNAGIKVNLSATSSFISKYAANSPPKDADVEWSAGYFNGGPRDVSVSQEPWDMSLNLGFNTYPYTPSSSKVFFKKKGTINYYGYYPDEPIAETYNEAAVATGEKRQQLFADAFAMINKEQPFGFHVMPSDIFGTQSELVGPTNKFASGWNYQTYYFKQ